MNEQKPDEASEQLPEREADRPVRYFSYSVLTILMLTTLVAGYVGWARRLEAGWFNWTYSSLAIVWLIAITMNASYRVRLWRERRVKDSRHRADLEEWVAAKRKSADTAETMGK
ncbi:MAG: hypothetical protein QGG36_14990 [Pirellulaceae bacterium]|nr:hypothetical protein [Pirellulaceae bacterium]